jgi:hypothetical protein
MFELLSCLRVSFSNEIGVKFDSTISNDSSVLDLSLPIFAGDSLPLSRFFLREPLPPSPGAVSNTNPFNDDNDEHTGYSSHYIDQPYLNPKDWGVTAYLSPILSTRKKVFFNDAVGSCLQRIRVNFGDDISVVLVSCNEKKPSY